MASFVTILICWRQYQHTLWQRVVPQWLAMVRWDPLSVIYLH